MPPPPTMTGFVWTPTTITPAQRALPGDLWCVRNAFCELLGWAAGSPDWSAFIELPQPQDIERLLLHLGLEAYDPQCEPHKARLVHLLDHPGIDFYDLHAVRISHCIFEPHLRHRRGLPEAYQGLRPDLIRVVPDPRQPPR